MWTFPFRQWRAEMAHFPRKNAFWKPKMPKNALIFAKKDDSVRRKTGGGMIKQKADIGIHRSLFQAFMKTKSEEIL